MRWLLLSWFVPVGFLASWLLLAPLDLGLFLYSRAVYERTFAVYGGALGMAPEALPPLVWKALVVDSLIVLGLYALRRWRTILAFLRGLAPGRRQDAALAARIASLSKAP